MQTYAKLMEGQLVTTCAAGDDQELIEQIKADGFKIYDEDAGKPEIGEFQALSPVYRETEDTIYLYWEISDNNPDKIKEEIARLEQKLTATDYRVVKSYEYSLAGEEIPYDISNLHSERQRLRDRISELEQLLPKENPGF